MASMLGLPLKDIVYLLWHAGSENDECDYRCQKVTHNLSILLARKFSIAKTSTLDVLQSTVSAVTLYEVFCIAMCDSNRRESASL